MQKLDFLAIGDITTDTFIQLKDASVHCDIDRDNCTISMRWGDKIPFDSAVTIPAVGNSANAAIAAARLGLRSGLLSWIGKDAEGREDLSVLETERVDASKVAVVEGVDTNHHYVLSFESERTILVKQNAFPYALPTDLEAPSLLYLSSLGEASGAFHADIARFIAAHPETRLVFQPGTFQMKMGIEALTEIYAHTYLFICNKEEAERILGHTEPQERLTLLAEVAALGPKIVAITDGRAGAYAYDGKNAYSVPLYPDERPPVERTGAGDAFASTLACALILGEPLEKALLWGPINSMSVVQHVGARAGLLSREKVLGYLQAPPETYRARSL
ncbi:MAG: carbohydrate kinase family protein [bacterium]